MTVRLQKATLLFLLKGNQILLAMKKRGFGAGKWNGVGGKPEADESIEETAVRECREEIGVTPISMKHVAELDFQFPAEKSNWNQRVYVYVSSEWQGEPIETEEMRPQWFDLSDIPYNSMWTDDIYWLPQVLDGKFVTATFSFDTNENLTDHHLIIDKVTA